MSSEGQLEIKFRLYDGSDIGPSLYAPATTVQALKEKLVADWPQDKKIVPKTTSDLKLINAGKILENNKTLAESTTPMGELPAGMITMHVVVQPSLPRKKTGWIKNYLVTPVVIWQNHVKNAELRRIQTRFRLFFRKYQVN